jgi:hypothetical protein
MPDYLLSGPSIPVLSHKYKHTFDSVASLAMRLSASLAYFSGRLERNTTHNALSALLCAHGLFLSYDRKAEEADKKSTHHDQNQRQRQHHQQQQVRFLLLHQ